MSFIHARFAFAASAVIALSGMSSLCGAATITAGGGTLVARGGQAPGSASDYDFSDFGGAGTPANRPTHLTNFTVSTAGDSQYPGGGNADGNYTTMIAPGGSAAFSTGIAYVQPFSASTDVVATFSPTFNGNFSVYVLDGNTDGNGVGNASVGLGVNGGAEVSTATVNTGGNEFTRFDVSGATTSDTFQVYATTTAAHAPSLAGLTFSVPEPASLGLLAVAGASLVARRRRI